jgi:ATP-dependent protease ClpP protease subunit
MSAEEYTKLRWDAGLALATGTLAGRVDSLNSEIYFNGAVTEESIICLIGEFTKVLDKPAQSSASIVAGEGAPAHVTLYLDSGGGAVKDAFKFIDFVTALKQTRRLHLTTVCLGIVASAATLMALMGDVRYITPNAIFMIHELSCGVGGTFTHISSRMKFVSMVHERILSIYLECVVGLAREELEKLLSTETWFSATECAARGFAEVLDRSK